MGGKDGFELRPEADISHLFGQGNLIFIRKKSGRSQGILKSEVRGNHENILTNYYNDRVLLSRSKIWPDRGCGRRIADNFVHGTNFIRTVFLNV